MINGEVLFRLTENLYVGMFNTEEEAYQKRVDFEKENGIVNKYL